MRVLTGAFSVLLARALLPHSAALYVGPVIEDRYGRYARYKRRRRQNSVLGLGLVTSRAPLGAPAPPGPIRRARTE